MPARFSKCDFWNLGEIWDRNRYPKTFVRIFFRRKKKIDRKFFVEKKFIGKKTLVNFFSIKKIRPKKYFSTKMFWDFFRRKIVGSFFFGYLFRCEISPRFQKSHLEQRATIKKIVRAKSHCIRFACPPRYVRNDHSS